MSAKQRKRKTISRLEALIDATTDSKETVMHNIVELNYLNDKIIEFQVQYRKITGHYYRRNRWNMLDLNNLIEKRMQRVMILVESTTKKICKKEFKKFKKDISRRLKNGIQRNERWEVKESVEE